LRTLCGLHSVTAKRVQRLGTRVRDHTVAFALRLQRLTRFAVFVEVCAWIARISSAMGIKGPEVARRALALKLQLRKTIL
jgi:hypothetical protein